MNDKKIGIFQVEFRPDVIEDLVLPERIFNLFADGEVGQHYLFYSSKPGSGKSSLAKILAKKYDYLYINASTERGIETIRGQIREFANGASILGGQYLDKLVILDEVHGSTPAFFDALLGVIEEYADHVKFIATCNYLNRIPENARSRFYCIDFAAADEEEEKFLKKGLAKRTYHIIKTVGMKISKETLIELINRNFPDMRSIINRLDYFYRSNIVDITLEDVVKSMYYNTEIFELCCKNNSIDIYKKVIHKHSGNSDDIIASLGSEFILWLEETYPEKIENIGVVASLLDVINEASYKRTFVIDRMLNLTNCIFKIQQILNTN